MSSQSHWDDAQIHAYVDGALGAEAAARLEADSRRDAALASRIARQRELRASLRASFDPVLDEPIPQRLLDTLARSGPGGVVTPIGAARKDRAAVPRRWSLREWSAIAATLVIGVLLGLLAVRTANRPIEPSQNGLVAAGYLDAALSTQLSGGGEDAGAAARIGMTFRAAAGEYCRTFMLRSGEDGLACRRAGRWSIVALEDRGAGQPDDGGFRQASSALSPAMLDTITSLGAGDPLTADEERQRVGQGWDTPVP